MTTWADTRNGLASLTRTLTGIQSVRWLRDAGEFADANDQAKIDLSIVSSVSVGQAERKLRRATTEESETYGYEPWGGVEAPAIEGVAVWRNVVVRFLIESYFDSEGEAEILARRLTSRLRFGSSRRALRTIGLGFGEVLSTQDLSRVRDDRYRSIVAIDVRFSSIATEEDLENPQPTIERTELG